MNDKLKRYIQLKQKIKLAEMEIETLSPEIKDHLVTQGIEKLPTDLGTFSVGRKTTWKYSDDVEKLQDKEKAEGIAKPNVSEFLKFTFKKDKDE